MYDSNALMHYGVKGIKKNRQMISSKMAVELIESKFKDSVVYKCMELPDGYLMSMRPKQPKAGYLLDPFFKMTNKGEVFEYSPVYNINEFNEARKHVVYSIEDQ